MSSKRPAGSAAGGYRVDLHGLSNTHRIGALAERLAKQTHFTLAECKTLIFLHSRLESIGELDRMRMREVLHVMFDITDEVMLDLAYKAFDRDFNGRVDEAEWVQGLSTMLRGTTEELSDWCYYIYDINGDGGLAREELSQCLKGCILPGYGVDHDEIEECERDIVEIAMKKLDVDLDGQITFEDFKKAVRKDPLLLVSVGPCLPPVKCCAGFLALITDRYRSYSGAMPKKPRRGNRNMQVTLTHSSSKHSNMSDDDLNSEFFDQYAFEINMPISQITNSINTKL